MQPELTALHELEAKLNLKKIKIFKIDIKIQNLNGVVQME